MSSRGGEVRRRGRYWWIGYYIDGCRVRVSTRQEHAGAAWRILRNVQADAKRNRAALREAMTVIECFLREAHLFKDRLELNKKETKLWRRNVKLLRSVKRLLREPWLSQMGESKQAANSPR